MKIRETKNLYYRDSRMFVVSGSTLMEVLIASSIGVLVLAALIGLMTTQVQEQRKEMVDSNLQQQANLLEDKITRLFRSMSAGQAVILGNPISAGSPSYHLIVVARGSAPIAREQVAFDPATFTCAYTPSLAVPGTRQIYFGQSKLAVLRD
ncbi:MAG: hypothetical protein JWM99_1751, partial [Verrucomicrobiales bacterium]|nr:hypothetical protein [Verrucomicrobiales bacterium]